jgi:hypothetical protein
MRIRTISILVVAISSMLLARPAGAWREDHHPGIVTDALDYMLDHSDDALMQAAAEWLWWAPGSNHLLMDKDYYLDPEPRCHENADGYPGYYSAACALRAETSNSDWYSDMFAVINPRGLYAACILPDFRPDYCELGTSLLVSAEVLATAGMGTIGMVLPGNYPLMPVELPIAHHGDLNVTSLNHMGGMYYDSDRVERGFDTDYPYTEDACLAAEQRETYYENLGYLHKNLDAFCGGQGCGEGSEGDCFADSGDMEKMSFLCHLGNLGLVWIDPDTAGERYNGLTCHQHTLDAGQNIAAARYLPVDSMAAYWMFSWQDVVELGPALHAAQDAFEPHHNYNYLGRGHSVFEEWAANLRNTRELCRQASGSGVCESDEFLEEELYSPEDVYRYLDRDPWQRHFLHEDLPENIVANAAVLAADWDQEAGDVAANPGDETYQKAITWQANNTSLAQQYAEQEGWQDPLGLGHNLAVTVTAVLLGKAFDEHYSSWQSRGYCEQLRQADLEQWYRIVPGPPAGGYLPQELAGGWYIRLQEGTAAESGHPYYNDGAGHPSNRMVFSVPHRVFYDYDVETTRIRLAFNQRCDWHEQEGDAVVVRARWFVVADDRLSDWEEIARFEHPAELAGQTVTLEPPGAGLRLARVEVELVQGHLTVAGGQDGEVVVFDGQDWTALEPVPAGGMLPGDVTGIWSSPEGRLFAVTAGGQVWTLQLGAGSGWEQMETGIFRPGGYEAVWGTAENDVYAVGDWWGYVDHWDGVEWSVLLDGGGDGTGLHGIWGSGPEDVYAVGQQGAVMHFDDQDWELMHSHPGYDLEAVHGASPQEVAAVGTGETVLWSDGQSWTEIHGGGAATLRGVWVGGGELFAAGDGGLVLHHDGLGWTRWSVGAGADLEAIWGLSPSQVYVAGAGGTVALFDGQSWREPSGVPTGVGLQALAGMVPRCSPERRYGFRVDRVEAEVREHNRPPGNIDSLQIVAEIVDWIHDGLVTGHFEGLGIIYDCAPGSACDQAIQGELQDIFGEALAGGGVLETEQVFDIVHEAFTAHADDPAVCPALSALALVRAVQATSPGHAIVDSGLAEAAAGWSLRRQGLRDGRRGRPGPVEFTASLDLDEQPVGNRTATRRRAGGGLPGMAAPPAAGWPGFRPPSAGELADAEGIVDYLQQRRRSLDRYLWHNLDRIVRGNIAGLIAVLDTDASGNPAAEQRLAEHRTLLEDLRHEIDMLADDDGDGVSNRDDLCPDECARGMDADGDGCIDTACGLGEEVGLSVRWWLPGLVLGLKAHRACWHAERGRTRPAVAQLRVFARLVWVFGRLGWISDAAAEHLREYANNARAGLLGDFSRLDCP